MERPTVKSIGDVEAILKKLELVPPKFRKSSLNVEGCEFLVIDRVNEGLSAQNIESSIKKAWPFYVKLFGKRISKAVVVDFEAPIGGGPLSLEDHFIVGIYTADSIDLKFQDDIQRIMGWKNQSNTLDYIRENYSQFKDPVQAYTDDMVFHELGHLFFGFGLTETEFKNISVNWVALGLGVVYDRLIWNRFYSQPSPAFENLIQIWKSKFSQNKEIDQRLISPDTTKDTKFGLERVQTYNHGKAFVFLNELREQIGQGYFDLQINKLFDESSGAVLNYDLLVQYLTQDSNKKLIIEILESKYVVK